MSQRVPDGVGDSISIQVGGQVGGNVVAGHGNVVGHLPGTQSGRVARNAAPTGVAAGRAEDAETLVFINYRSGDNPSAAAFLHAELSDRFGLESVFLDYESIPLGADFVPVLLDRVRGCAVLVIVVGDRWLAGEVGRRPIDDPEDWVRREILEALEHGVPVVPVLMGGMLTPDRLPPELAGLTDRQYFEIRDRRQRMDIQNLGDYLARHIPRLRDR